MKLYDFIREGFREVEAKFVAAGADADLVKNAIQQYRDLVNRNQVTGNERNIDWWGKNRSFADFAKFLDQQSLDTSKSQIKKSSEAGRSITLMENDLWLVVVPLDKDASCFHGKNSDWCTTKREHGYFEDYFYNKSIILIYCLNKKTGGMWALANYRHVALPDEEEDEDPEIDVDELERNNWAELFDQQDQSITAAEFQQQTGLDSVRLLDLSDQRMAPGAEIDNRLRGRQQQLGLARKQIQGGVKQRDLNLERELIDLGDDEEAYKYAAKLGNMGLDLSTLPLKLQYLAARSSIKGSVLQWMTNPDSKIVNISIKNQRDAISILIDRDQMTPKLLDSIDISRFIFNQELLQKLVDKDMFTPKLRDRLAQDSSGVYVLHKLGKPVSQSEVEASIVKHTDHTRKTLILNIQYAVQTFGFTPSSSLFEWAAKLLGTTTDDFKRQILDHVKLDVESQTRALQKLLSEQERAKFDIKSYQSYVDKAQAELDELSAQERLSFSQQDSLRNAKADIRIYQWNINDREAFLKRNNTAIEDAKKQINKVKAVTKKIK